MLPSLDPAVEEDERKHQVVQGLIHAKRDLIPLGFEWVDGHMRDKDQQHGPGAHGELRHEEQDCEETGVGAYMGVERMEAFALEVGHPVELERVVTKEVTCDKDQSFHEKSHECGGHIDLLSWVKGTGAYPP